MNSSPLTLEWDESGLHLTLDLELVDDVVIESLQTGARARTTKVRGRLSTSAAIDLYDHVRDQLGEWASEAASARSAVAAGVTLSEYVGDGSEDDDGDVLDPSDPKHPGYADTLAAGGDARRKEARENG